MLKILIQAKISELQERQKLKERPKANIYIYIHTHTHIWKDRDKDTKQEFFGEYLVCKRLYWNL